MKRGFLNSKKAKNEALYPVEPLTSPISSPASSVGLAAALPSGEYRTSYLGGIPLIITFFVPGPNTVVRLPYGKVENTGLFASYKTTHKFNPTRTALPTSYNPAKFTVSKSPAIQTNHPANTMLMTTIPARFDGRPPDPDGHSEWIVHAPTKSKVLNAPGYPQPVPKLPGNVKPYVVKSTPTMGKGVFATRDIPMGGIVFAERPLLVVPSALTESTGVDINEYSLADYTKIMLFEKEQKLEVAVGRMQPDRRAKLMALTNSHLEDGSGPIHGIVRTNGYGVQKLYDGDGQPEGGESNLRHYSVVCDVGSRINHRFRFSCIF